MQLTYLERIPSCYSLLSLTRRWRLPSLLHVCDSADIQLQQLCHNQVYVGLSSNMGDRARLRQRHAL